ncbi:YkgJ family cysteine cluster protein [Halovivax limisalsi]|uniref:YkgJ family cysteine cluster protein n=1 Tax=Halovivax limisalsi TaxID=1453760 RepID=UPI001FFD4CFA|nr:YkgJ family cysteine cluster protein [Halovivax limisalsi]
MELRCRGCAGCCLDWRPLVGADGRVGEPESGDGRVADVADPAGGASEFEDPNRGPFPSLDDVYNLVPLERDEVRAFVDDGLGDVLAPRLWAAGPDDPRVEVGDHRVAAVAGRPAFFVGLRKPPKPVAPFGREEPTWLPTCTFLDPETLQCRIHEDERYPAECGAYPAHNLALSRQTECERVEDATGEPRLLSVGDDDPTPPDDRLLLGPQAIGGKVFCHPDPSEIEGAVDRLARGEATAADRAAFVAVAAASSPGMVEISDRHYEEALERTIEASSWAGRAIEEWERLAEDAPADPSLAERVETARGAPETPGWEDLAGDPSG